MTPAQILDFLEVVAGDAFDVAPEVAIAYFNSKGLTPTFSYADMLGEAHDQAFTVAKMMDVDLLAHVRKSLDTALATGQSFGDWKRELQPTLQAAGWWGKGDVLDPLTGATVTAQLGSPWRLETIFRTNMQTAYAVGQWQEIESQAEVAPYLMYDAIDDHRTRPLHAKWDRTVLPVKHAWWKTHFPPNGYNCRCSVIQLSREEVEELGLLADQDAPEDGTYTWTNPRTGRKHQVPEGLDPGFNRNPGALYLEHINKMLAEKIGALPPGMKARAAASVGNVLDPEEAAKLQAQARAQAKEAKAQAAIDQALEAETPYLSAAIKQIQKTKAADGMTPSELLAKAQDKAAKTEQSVALQHYKQAALAGKEPSAKAKQAFAALDPDEQAKIAQQIAASSAAQAAQEAIDALAAGQGKVTQQKALQQLQASGQADALSPVELLAQVDKLALEIQAKASQSAAVSGYKKKAIAGQIPTPAQQAAFKALDPEKQAKVLAEIDAAKKPPVAPPETPEAAPAPAPAPEAVPSAGAPLNARTLIQIGPQRGSNPGGLYQDTETGIQWYVKRPGSADKVRNEVLAGKLYQAAGVEVPQLEITQHLGEPAIASRIIDGLAKGAPDALAKAPGARENFVVDAWLGNWDVVGAVFDNLLVKAGRAVRVDTGGALRYRAQGTLKGEAWGDTVGEIDSMRNPGDNLQAAEVFGAITPEELLAGARRVLAVSEAQIRDLVERFGPTTKRTREDLIKTLLARQADIARRFPEARQAPAAAPKPADVGARVTAQELKTIKDSRLNGYAVPTDKDAIEDQEVLVWHERAKGKADVTAASLKVRGRGAEALDRLIVNADDGQVNVLGNINSEILQAVKGISANHKTEGLRAKDVERANKALASWADVQRRMNAERLAGTIKVADMRRINELYEPWIKALREAADSPLGTKNFWRPPPGGFEALENPERVSTGDKPAVQFQRKRGTPFTTKEIRRGRAEDTGQATNAPESEYYEAMLADGTVVRYFDSSNPLFALRGRVEIRAPGSGEASVARIFEAIEELGVDASRSSPLDAEELYLTQIAYARKSGWKALQNRLKKAAGQDERVDLLRQHLTKEIGQDPRTLPGYNPDGQYEAFGHGHRLRYRPDIAGPEWERFEQEYRLHHNITNGTLTDALDAILNAGGKMAPTTDKLRRGIRIGGMSPDSDLETGGASYFFTRIKTAREAAGRKGLVWKAGLVRRVDAISYDSDKFGRVSTEDFVLKNRKSSVEEWRQAASAGNNETIFKNSLSLFDQLDRIVTGSATERRQIIELFRKHGYDHFPDGRSLEEVIQ